METGTIIAIASLLVAFGGFVVVLIFNIKGSKKGDTAEARADGELKADIKHIRSTVDVLVSDGRRAHDEILSLTKDMGIVQRDVTTLHNRVDAVKKDVEFLKGEVRK